MGFSTQEFSGMQIGNPFTIYVFDDDANLIYSEVLAFPLLYLGDIIGVIETSYIADIGDYAISIRKAYGNELNKLKNQQERRRSQQTGDFVIGVMGDKLFATNGEEVSIFLDTKGMDGSTSVTIDEISDLASDIIEEASSDYAVATEVIDEVALQNSFTPLNASSMVLAVPHVAQTGVCGIAAWAAVLNFRFKKSYTNASLDTAMRNAGYTLALPNMNNYRDYANGSYSAGAVVAGVPSFNTVTNAIVSHKPIMGNWNSSATKEDHAVIIVGYIVGTSYTYYVKNPWYTTRETISVANASTVNYVAGGRTWRLNQIVY